MHAMLRTLRDRRRCGGVTLVEVVIAIFILTVGILGIISLFPTGYKLGQRAFDRSVGALAARDALPRIMGELRRGALSYPNSTQTPLSNIQERDRVGTISQVVSAKSLRCKTRGGEHTPSYTGLTGGYYLVMTSGSAVGKLYRITGASSNQLTFNDATFRTANANEGDPIRVGDHYAIIGSKSPPKSKCYPTTFLTTGANNRTRECASHGNREPRYRQSSNPPWEYSYGCVLSAPSKEMAKLYRVDVFVFRAFEPGMAVDKQRPASHYVTYIAQLDDYDSP